MYIRVTQLASTFDIIKAQQGNKKPLPKIRVATDAVAKRQKGKHHAG